MTETSHRLLITCEHGGNRIPRRYRNFFADAEAVLQSHRGYDRGALTLARELAHALGAPLIASTTSRLLVDLNRSHGHPRLFGETIRRTPPALRQEILARHYRPYRRRAENLIAETLAQGLRVIHVSCHSFTPVLDGEVRKADIGLLYDPARPGEKALCAAWRRALRERLPEFKVRFNYPYAGKADGFTAFLRRTFPPGHYVGVELEINQRHVGPGPRAAAWRGLRTAVIESLQQALLVFPAGEPLQRVHEIPQALQEHFDRQDAQDKPHQARQGGHDAVAEQLDEAGGRQEDDRVQGHRQR